MLSTTLRPVLIDILKRTSDQMGNAGCNDFYLDDTPDNRAMVQDAEALAIGEEARDIGLSIHAGKLLTQDTFIVDYIIHLLEQDDK